MRVDGGMTANDWMCQFLADILDLPVERPRNRETTALGVAFLAGLATGVWPDVVALSSLWQCQQRFEPKISAARRGELVSGWRQAVHKILTTVPEAARNASVQGSNT
jgi:glycerol kinase